MARTLLAPSGMPPRHHLLLAFLSFQACKGDDAKAAIANRVVAVTVVSAEQKDVPLWLEGLGSVAAWQQVTVRSLVDGRLDKVSFKEGQAVKRGDVLAQIDPRPFLVQLHQAEGALARDRAQADAAKLSLERLQALRKDSLVSQQDVDNQLGVSGQLLGTVQMDEAAIETAKLSLDYARITAPIDGVLGVRLVDQGNLVHPSDANGIVVITQLDPIAIYFTLPEDDLARISDATRKGPLAITVFNRDGQTELGKGELLLVDNQINQATATLRLKARVPNPEHKMWPNQFVRVRMLLDTEKDALVVPQAAVQRGQQGTFVYVLTDDQTAAMRPIVLGPVAGDAVIVEKGLAAGTKVITEGQSQLRPGAKVQAREAGAPQVASGKR